MNSVIAVLFLLLSAQGLMPSGFVQVAGPTLKARFDAAIQQGRRGTDDSFWVAYQFPVRAGVRVDSQYGGISVLRPSDGIEFVPPDGNATRVGLFFLTRQSDGVISKARMLDMNGNYVFHDRKIYWMGDAPSPDSLDLLMNVLRDSPTVASPVTTAISIHDTSGAVDKLIAIARGTYPDGARRSAISQLGEEASRQAANELDRMANDPSVDSELQRQVVSAIGRRTDDEAVPMLIRIARDNPTLAVRRQAIAVLGQKQDKRAIDFLAQQLQKK